MQYSHTSFPPYRYVPGRAPHPTRSPEGHSYQRELAPVLVDEDSWRNCEPYLHAIDLFNHGYFWESHEHLEAIWHGVGPDSAIGIFSQAVIQAAAALLKHSMGSPDSASRLASAATDKLRGGAALILGVDTEALASQLETYLDGRRPQPPRIELRT